MTVKRIQIDEGWLRYYATGYAVDLGIFCEHCPDCKALLGIGDFIDGLYPFDTQYNSCRRCREAEAKREKKELIQL